VRNGWERPKENREWHKDSQGERPSFTLRSSGKVKYGERFGMGKGGGNFSRLVRDTGVKTGEPAGGGWGDLEAETQFRG